MSFWQQLLIVGIPYGVLVASVVGLAKVVGGVSKAQDALQREMTLRFDALEKLISTKFANVDSKFDTAYEKIGRVDDKVERIDNNTKQ